MRKDIGRSQRKETNVWVDKPAIGRSRGEDARVTRFRPSPRRLFGAKQFHARRNLKISRSGSRKGSPSLVARGMSMKAGYDSLLLVFLRTVSAPIRIARSRYRHLSTNSRRFFSTVSLLFGNHQPIADEDDLFRCHAKLFRLSSTGFSATFESPRSNRYVSLYFPPPNRSQQSILPVRNLDEDREKIVP